MKIIIRADASNQIGNGHVMRCLVLAQKLKKSGHSIYFACRPQPGDLIEFIRKRGFNVIRFKRINRLKSVDNDKHYESWLQVTPEQEIEEFSQHIESADLIIVDHYGISKEWEQFIRRHFKCKIVVIDDLLRRHDADLIIDQTLSRDGKDYNSKGITLTGSNYALLDSRFALKREQALTKPLPAHIKLLVSMGGVDLPNATLKILKCMIANRIYPITVLLQKSAPHYYEVSKFCQDHQEDITHIDFVDDMASLMLEHDLAIGAPGTTSWERACLGLPSILIPIADNQKYVGQSLVEVNAAIKVGLNQIDKDLLPAYNTVCQRLENYRINNLSICDGLGVNRVSREINLLFSDVNNQIKLRLASKQDIRKVYEWQCHPETRKFSLNPSIPNWQEHSSWMQNKLRSPQDFFYIIQNYKTENDIGVLRLDHRSFQKYLVSIFLDPQFYGNGFGSKALQALNEIHPHVTLNATVLKNNKASQNLFKKANFLQISEEHFIRKPIT